MARVLNTRPRGQGAGLSAALRAAGHEPLELPLIELALLPDARDVFARPQVARPDTDGILLTSPNLLPLLEAAGIAVPGAWRNLPWYLVGPRARADVEALGARVAFVPELRSLEGLLDEWPRHARNAGIGTLRLLHPCSTGTQLDPETFAKIGLQVANLPLYAPRCPDGTAEALAGLWPRAEAVLFASGSAVDHLAAVSPGRFRAMGAGGPLPVAIGASTTRALRAHGVEPAAEAPTADNDGFIAALATLFPGPNPGTTP